MQSIQTAQPLTNSSRPTMFRVRGGKTYFRLLLIVISIAAGLVLSEVVMRAFQLGNPRSVVLYNDKIFKLPPHVSLVNYYENKNVVETNNLGFHDRERQATNDNYRILFIGDSFVEARQVDTKNLFTILLENKFSQDGKKIETINGGVPGTGTAYQYVLWKEFFEPSIKVDHLVLCLFMGNDLTDNNPELKLSTFGDSDNSFFVDSEGNIIDTRKKVGPLKKTINYVRDHSVLMDSLYEGAYRIKKTREEEPAGAPATEGGRVDSSSAWQSSEQGTIALIKRWKSELADKKIPFDVVLIDQPGKVYNKFQLDFINELQQTCTRDHIDYLRLKLTEDPYQSYSFDGTTLGHFNYKGHELAADELYDYFRTHHAAIFNRPVK